MRSTRRRPTGSARGVDHRPARHLHGSGNDFADRPPAQARLDRVAGVPVHARTRWASTASGSGRHRRSHRHRHHAAACVADLVYVSGRARGDAFRPQPALPEFASSLVRRRALLRQRQGGRQEKLLLSDPFHARGRRWSAHRQRGAARRGWFNHAARGRAFQRCHPAPCADREAAAPRRHRRRAGRPSPSKGELVQCCACAQPGGDGSSRPLSSSANPDFRSSPLRRGGPPCRSRPQAGPCACWRRRRWRRGAAPPRRCGPRFGRARCAWAMAMRLRASWIVTAIRPAAVRRRGHAGGGARRSSLTANAGRHAEASAPRGCGWQGLWRSAASPRLSTRSS